MLLFTEYLVPINNRFPRFPAQEYEIKIKFEIFSTLGSID
jgi:hypothetical protein